MKKRILSVLLTLAMVLTLLPTTAMAAPSSISVTNATYHSSGALASIETSFYWNTASAPGRLVLMTEKLNTTTSSKPVYGDFTDMGTYASSFANFDDVKRHDATNGTFGIISSSDETKTNMSQTNTKSIAFDEGDIPLDKNQLYYVYLWTQYSGNCYPDTLICAIQVFDGGVQYASATGRNSYDDTAFQKVINDSVSYGVTVTPADNMTKTSGSESQTGLKGAMEPVIYTADTGYEFPETYAVAAKNGIMVRRDSATQITVIGTPTANADIILTAPPRRLPTLEEMTFGYAYDVQRSPAYPKQDDVTVSSLTFPLDADGISDYATKAGSWTLTRAGTYAYVKSIGKDSATLKSVVNNIVSNYTGITADEVVIHELKEGTKHIAYGVTVAYNAEDGTALYIGGNRSGGAGYLLSLNEVTTDPIHMTANMVATDFVPTREITLSQTGTHTFAGKTVGYTEGNLTALTVTATNSGNTATGALNVSLSGDAADSFGLNGVDDTFKAGIAADGGTDTFTVVPKTDLSAGSYTATVTVSGVDVKSAEFYVSFTVSAPTYTVDITAGSNMTLASGTGKQENLSGAMTNVVYTAVDGYYFPENYTVAPVNGITVTRNSDSQITVSGTPTADVDLVLAAASPKTYTVTFHTNGGTGSMADQTYTHGAAQALTANTFARSSYTFAGWATSADGDVAYSDGQSISLTANTDLYAKWTLNADAVVTDVEFTYAYDVYRDPDFPAKGDSIRLYNIDEPIMDDGTEGVVAGTWTLTEIDSYFNFKGVNTSSDSQKSNLQSVVDGVAGAYTASGITADEIIVHELKEAGSHVAYGVIVAYDAATGRAVFLGDTWSGGAGYLLGIAPQTDSTVMTATDVPTDFIEAATYRIELDKLTHTFPAATVGYGAQTPVTVTVTNNGSEATGALTVALSGTHASSFTLSKTNIDDILFGANDTFTVVPNTGLSAGTYTATVTVSGVNVVPKSVTMSFTVNARSTSSGGSSTPSYAVEVTTDGDANVKTVSNRKNANKGDTVTITVTPEEYYAVETVIVKDKDGKTVEVKDNGDGTYTFKMPASKVTVEAVYAWENPFTDVNEDAYYAPAVEWALNEGVTGGTTAATFAPNAACTRAQMVTFLWRAAGSPAPKTEVCPFADVDMDSYYGKAVLWAVENGITMGTTDTTFSPYTTCTRAHMATFLCRMEDGEASGTVNPFTDVPSGVYYTEPVQWAVENGITNGTTATTYSPNATCTRGQMVTSLWRCLG